MNKLVPFLLLIALPFTIFSQALMLYGGPNHKTFLGVLNGSKYDSKSIWNQYATYGSRYSSDSIWNPYSTYGSVYNSYSPWNQYTSTPPIIVDNTGRSYGYFTRNKYLTNRTKIDWLLWILDNYDDIKEDTGKAYDYLF